MSDSAAQPPERRPALRASDADRERVVDILRRAAGEGLMGGAELRFPPGVDVQVSPVVDRDISCKLLRHHDEHRVPPSLAPAA